MSNDMNHKDSDKKPDKAASSNGVDSVADYVDSHLQTLENSGRVPQQRPLSPEKQLFTEEELARLINPDKLKVLMESGDDLVGYLTSEIDKFED